MSDVKAPDQGIYQRKLDHIELSNSGDVAYGEHRGLFEELQLVHDAMPELAMSELDLSTPFLDHELGAPIMVTGMTGGPDEAARINAGISKVCAKLRLPFGVGSQRVITKAGADAATLASFSVRSHAPDVILVGNLGVNQARDMGPAAARELMDRIEANYLAIHLNPAMELVQPGADADSDFTSGYETIARVVEACEGRVVVKECGTGVAPWVLRRLYEAGVRAVDLSGSGGTSWVKVEARRAEQDPTQAELAALGREFGEWGIPTAATVVMAQEVEPRPLLIASGGIDGGLTAAKALVLGADVAGSARPVLQAFMAGGEEGAEAFLTRTIAGVRTAMALTGCRRPTELRRVPRIMGPRLRAWAEQSRNFKL